MAELPIDDVIRTNCPRDCYDGCGIWVRRRGNRILSVRGDPHHPVNRGSLCGKCSVAYNGIWQSENERLLYPKRRVGPKGSGRFERISWTKALTEIAERLTSISTNAGPHSIVHTHYSGTISLLAYLFPMRFFNRLGATEVEPDSICNLAGHVAWNLLFGNSSMGFDPRTARDASSILVWGANPSHCAPHMDRYWLGDFKGNIIVVDPVRTETAVKATLHLQLYPGTDASLAFGLLHVLQREGQFNKDFLAAHTIGADELIPRLERCTPAWTESETGVPAAQVETAARLYASGPSLLWAGQGFQRQHNGGNAMRAIGLLPTFTGNIGRPGSGFLYLNSTPKIFGADFEWLTGSSLSSAEVNSVSHMGLAHRLEDPSEFKAFLSWNMNPVASAPDQKRLRRALADDGLFSIVIDCFQTDTADYADIVLPAASFLEFDDITFSYMNLLIGAQAKVCDPMGESLSNMEIFRKIASAMGYTENSLFESDISMLNELLSQMEVGFDFEELKKRGHHLMTDTPHIQYQDFSFQTPSGKIEIASNKAEELGLPRIPSPASDFSTDSDQLRLLSPASKWRLNDSFANENKLESKTGRAQVILHPLDAERIGVLDGAPVQLKNECGVLELEVKIASIAPRGVAISYKGRWPKLEGSSSNVNVLHDGSTADMGESSAVHSTQVSIIPL